MDVTSGTLIGAYRLDRLLGKGSMGAVWVGEDIHLRRRVAVKVLAPDLADDDRFRRRFLLESQLAASLEHPHIVPIYAAGEEDGSLFLAMRLIEGIDLRALLRERHHLDPRRALALLGQAAEGLDAAHAIGLVHRDVKPANVLVAAGPPEHAYLCDFGLAKHASSVDSLTGERSFVGTISYIAPEQIEGGPVDARADQYALGCVLYECLTGVKPYEREGELQTLFAHLREDAPRVTDVEPALGGAIDEVVARALDKDPNARFATCTEMIESAGAALGLAVEHHAAPRAQIVPRTFLIADVRGYTAFTSEHGDEAAGRLAARFEQAMREVADAHDGRVLEIRGDEALAVFDSARNALRAALAAQARFAEDPPARGVGIGIDTGEAAPTGEGFRGSALNTAARLCSLAGPGDVLASETTTKIAGATDDIAFGQPREERVKGLPQPVRFAPIHSPGAAVPSGRGRRSIPRPRVGRRAAIATTIVVVTAALAGLAAFLLTSGDADAAIQGPALAGVDPATGSVRWQVSLDEAPDPITRTKDGSIWGWLGGQQILARFDPVKREIVDRVNVGRTGKMAVAYESGIWVMDEEKTVRWIDPDVTTATETVVLPKGRLDRLDVHWMVEGDGAVWVSYGLPFRIARIDGRTRKVTRVIDLPEEDHCCEGMLAYGDGQLWAVDMITGRAWRIDPERGRVLATGKIPFTEIAFNPEAMDVAGGYLWVATESGTGVWQISDRVMPLRSLHTGVLPWWVRAGAGAVWVPNHNESTISRIDTVSGDVRQVDIGARPLDLVPAEDELIVSATELPPDPYAGLDLDETLRMDGWSNGLYPVDPHLSSGQEKEQVADATDLRLVRFADPDGDGIPQLVPDGAELPAVSDGGRTYTFPLKTGYRFSPPSGKPVTPADWKASLERALSPKMTDDGRHPKIAPWVIPDVVGAEAFIAGRAKHVSGLRVRGRSLVVTLVRPRGDLPARLAAHPFAVVPATTPAVPEGINDGTIPSAGPYYLAALDDNNYYVYRRNPNYPGPRPAVLDAFVSRANIAAEPGIVEIEDGRSDFYREFMPRNAAPLQVDGEVARRYGRGPVDDRQYLRTPTALTSFLLFNTRTGPLSDVRLRRGISTALDRTAASRERGLLPADLLVPRPVPGSTTTQGRLFSLTPDAARARELLRGLDRPLTLLTGGSDNQRLEAEAVARDLARVGVSLRIEQTDYVREVNEGRADWDIVLVGWSLDWLDPYNVVNILLDPKGSSYQDDWRITTPLVTSRPLLARIRAADRLQGAARARAYQAIDREIVGREVIVAVIGTGTNAQLFSSRVGCRQPAGRFGLVDLTQICLR